MAGLQHEVPRQTEQRGIGALFSGLTKWQVVLSALPLLLIPLGGLVGGALGAAAAVANVKLAKTGLGAPLKALLMIAVTVAAVAVWLLIATLVFGR